MVFLNRIIGYNYNDVHFLQGISDGAAALVVATEEAVTKFNLKPLARVTGYSVVGCDPSTMGLGPVYAIENLMRAIDFNKEGKAVSNYFDLIEVTFYDFLKLKFQVVIFLKNK